MGLLFVNHKAYWSAETQQIHRKLIGKGTINHRLASLFRNALQYAKQQTALSA